MPKLDSAKKIRPRGPKKGGGKRYEFDPKQIEYFARRQTPIEEMAKFYGCDEGTIRKRFSGIIQKAKSEGKIKLREAQYKSAVEDGNPTMLIWLGKQMLGQADKLDLDQNDTRTYNFNFTETEPG